MPYLDHDGSQLAYQDAGSGAPPLLLLHAGSVDPTPQIEHFRRRHRVVALAAGVLDVDWICRELGLYRPIVVELAGREEANQKIERLLAEGGFHE